LPEATSSPEKRKRTENGNSEPRKSCGKIMDFFRMLEEMEKEKMSEKSGRNTCKGPIGSKIQYSYRVKINDPEKRVEKPGRRVRK
jgi:hypothetical protein